MGEYVIVLLSSEECTYGASNCVLSVYQHPEGRPYTSAEANVAITTWPDGFMPHKMRLQRDHAYD